MKKYYLPLALLLFVRAANAQAPIAIGLTAGVNIATEDYAIQGDTNRATRKGLILCGQTDWPLFGPTVLQDRLYYIQKGVTANRNYYIAGIYQSTTTTTTELNYLELSLAPKYKIGLSDFKPYLFFGPRLGLLLSGNLVTTTGTNTRTQDVKTSYRALDFGLDMGAGFSLPVVLRLYFLADIGYSPGLTNIQQTDIAGSPSAFSRDLKIQAGFLLEIYNIAEHHAMY